MELCPDFLASMTQVRSSDSEDSPQNTSPTANGLGGIRRMSFLDEYSERVASRSIRRGSVTEMPTMVEMMNEITTMKVKLTAVEDEKLKLEDTTITTQTTLNTQNQGLNSLVKFTERLLLGCERKGRFAIQDEYIGILLNLFRCQDLEERLIKSQSENDSEITTLRDASWHLVQQEQLECQQTAQEEIASLRLRLNRMDKERTNSTAEMKDLKEANAALVKEVESLKAAQKSKTLYKEEKSCEGNLELYAPFTPSASSSECSFETTASENRQLTLAIRRAEIAEQSAAKYRKELFSTTRIENLQDMLLPTTPPKFVFSLRSSNHPRIR